MPHRSRSAATLGALLAVGICAIAPAARADDPLQGARPLWCVTTPAGAPGPEALLAGKDWPSSCLTGFVELASAKLSRSQPVVWLSCDGTALHVAWRIPRLGDAPFAAGATERDGPLWNDDSFEVFLDPGHTHREYLQFIINSAGTLYDGRGRDASWNSGAEVSVAQDAAAWAGVLTVPLAGLGAAQPPDGAVWGANFAVDRSVLQRPSDGWQQEDANLVWSPVSASLHEPARSGHLTFAGDARVSLATLGEPWWRSVRLGGLATCECQARLQDAAGASVWEASAPVGRALDLSAPALSPGSYQLTLQASVGGQAVAAASWAFDALPSLDVRIQTLALSHLMRVDVRSQLAKGDAEEAVGLALADASGKMVRSGELAPSSGTPCQWDFGDLAPGTYSLTAAQQGRADCTTTVPWERPEEPAWLGSTAGKFDDDTVLKPWLPLRVASRSPLSIGCWGRLMSFAGASGGLLSSAIAADQELLAAPMEWVAVVDGRPVRWVDRRVRVTRQARGAIEFASTLAGDGLRIEGHGRMEFDGFIRLDFRVSSPDRPRTLDRLELRVPFRKGVARLLHHFPKPSVWVKVDMSRFNARAVPPEGWRSPFLYHVWVGDEERGLQWLTESDQYWRPAEADRAIELIPSAEQTTLTLNLIGKPTRVDADGALPYSFAFQASPVKSTPRDYREWRYSQVGGYGMERAPYRRVAVDQRISYPAQGLFDPAKGTVEVTVIPHFDSTAKGELNRNLFKLAWPNDTAPEPAAGVWFYWNQDDHGMRVVVRQSGQYRVIYGAPCAWKPGEAHTVAFTWAQGGAGVIYVDGERLAEVPAGSCLDAATDLSRAVVSLGDGDSDFTVRQLRISSEPLPAEQLGVGGAALRPLASTLLLDRFDAIEKADGQRVTTPTRSASGAGGVLGAGVTEADGGLDLSGGRQKGTLLDSLRDQGLRTIGFHEGWTEWQGFPRTSQTDELRSLIAGSHKAGLRLILYHSWQLSDTAPEYPLYLSECEVIAPDRFIYTREHKQRDYPTCARSAWADFLADGIQKLFAEFGPDGIYSDGLAYPTECANTLHGCGYVGEDGQVHPTFSLFAMRDAVKRFAKILEDQGKPTLFVCHTSGSITLPTLSFCDAYLDGEHLTGQPRPFRIPLDAFRAEFMGHNFGLPAYFLVYDWNQGMTTQEGLAISLLHDTEVPWSFDAMAPIWNLWSRFGVSEARFLPYWKSAEWLQSAPEGVKVSAYLKPDGNVLVVAANLSEEPVRGELRLRGSLSDVSDALSTRPVGAEGGAIVDDFPVWTARLYLARLHQRGGRR